MSRLVLGIVSALLFITLIVASDDFDYDDPDFIVVGGGTAGSVLAANLSYYQNTTVLVLDEGDDLSDLVTNVSLIWNSPAFGAGGNTSKLFTLPYFAELQHSQEVNLGFRSLEIVLPKVLGGASSINGEAYSRASKDYLALLNNSDWTYEATLNDWKQIESCQGGGPACNPLYHGLNGPVATNIFKPNSHLAAIATSAKNVFGLSDNNDINGPVSNGFGWLPRNIAVNADGNPVRQDSYTRFLKPALQSQSNIKLLTRARVDTIDIQPNGKHKITYYRDGKLVTVKAKKGRYSIARNFWNTQTINE